jgi:hypothetical protein
VGALLHGVGRVSRRFRRRRIARLFELLKIDENTTVLDVGGTPEIWRLAPVTPRLVLLNHPRAAPEIDPGLAVVFGDGTELPFPDASFDVVFTNSVLEHVGDPGRQSRFAREVMRVGRSYWVQTPDRYFPVEQHLWMPLVHWLPSGWQRRVLRLPVTPWEWLAGPRPDQREFYIHHYLSDVRLLAAGELGQLFPGSRILRERFLGCSKSLIAVRSGIPPEAPS